MASGRKGKGKQYTPEQLERMAAAMEERRQAAAGGDKQAKKPGPTPGTWAYSRFKTRGQAQDVLRSCVKEMRVYDIALRQGRDPKLASPENPMPGLTPDIGQRIVNAIAIYIQSERATVEERLKAEQAARDAIMKERELTLKERQAGESDELTRLRAIVVSFEEQLRQMGAGGSGTYEQ